MQTPEPQGLGVDVVQLLSHHTMDCSMLGSLSLTISQSLLKFMSIESVIQCPQLFGDESLSWGREGKGSGRSRASGYSHAHGLSLSPPQCKPSRGRKRGICWCVDKYGMKLPGMEYVDGDFQCHTFDSSNVE